MRSIRRRRTLSRRHRAWNYRAYWIALVGAIIAAGSVVFAILTSKQSPLRQSASQQTSSQPGQIPSSRPAPLLDFQQRRLYPYSVIPGGLENGSDLRNAIAHDPLVAAHYADFDLAQARIVRLDRDEAVYVSFRLNERIYWTRKTLMLHRGETVITDGSHQARSRCGNRISVTPAEPVSPQEPSAQAMNAAPSFPLVAEIPEIWPNLESLTAPVFEPPANQTPPSSPPWIILPPFYPIGGGPGLTPPITPPPPLATPEPSAFLLLGLGFSTLGCARWLPLLKKRFERS